MYVEPLSISIWICEFQNKKTNVTSTFHKQNIIICCIVFAAKFEETVKKSRDIVVASYPVLKYAEIPADHPEVDAIKRQIVHVEHKLVLALDYDFSIVHPHVFMGKFAKVMKCMW